jgi:hypothetical protein
MNDAKAKTISKLNRAILKAQREADRKEADLPRELYEFLKAEAKAKGLTFGQHVVQILERHKFWSEADDNENETKASEGRNVDTEKRSGEGSD